MFHRPINQSRRPAQPGLRRRAPHPTGAFTLIEMMVVVGVIGLLAGMMIAAMPALTDRKIRKRIEVELAGLETAIQSYKADKGYFPPDNTNNVSQPPLFYELTGTVITNQNNGPDFISVLDQVLLPKASVKSAFNIDGFLNSGTDVSEIRNFYRSLKPTAANTNHYLPPNIKLLVVPYRGPANSLDPKGDFNPWRYNVSNPANNLNGFDLWAEITNRNKLVIIGNWKE